MSQATLTEDPPMILDATCSTGIRNRWPKFASLRMDVRAEVGPELIADARFMPFRDGSIHKIYCDPPHAIGAGKNSAFLRQQKFSRWFSSVNRDRYGSDNYAANLRRFGNWKTKEEWLQFVEATNSEFFRCLGPDGELHYKLCEMRYRTVALADLDLMTNFTIAQKKLTHSKWGRNPTYWLTMQPKAKAEGKE